MFSKIDFKDISYWVITATVIDVILELTLTLMIGGWSVLTYYFWLNENQNINFSCLHATRTQPFKETVINMSNVCTYLMAV